MATFRSVCCVTPCVVARFIVCCCSLYLATCSCSTPMLHRVCLSVTRHPDGCAGRLLLPNTKHRHMLRAYILSAVVACPLSPSHVTVALISLYRLLWLSRHCNFNLWPYNALAPSCSRWDRRLSRYPSSMFQLHCTWCRSAEWKVMSDCSVGPKCDVH